MIKATINDEYGYDNYEYLNGVISKTMEHEKVKDAIVDIVFVDNEKIREINRDYRHLDKITDVISFAFEDSIDVKYTEFRFLGEIYVSIPQMKTQALEYGHSEKRELSFLVVHGLLHLLGYDHETKDTEEKMNRLQELILNEQDIKR